MARCVWISSSSEDLRRLFDFLGMRAPICLTIQTRPSIRRGDCRSGATTILNYLNDAWLRTAPRARTPQRNRRAPASSCRGYAPPVAIVTRCAQRPEESRGHGRRISGNTELPTSVRRSSPLGRCLRTPMSSAREPGPETGSRRTPAPAATAHDRRAGSRGCADDRPRW